VSDPAAPRFSVVIPLYRERDNVDPLLDELIGVMEALGGGFEVLCVDDGSDDGTGEAITARAAADPRIRHLAFTRNHGQSAALDAGFRAARGELVVTMDGDMQCDPAAIPTLVEHLDRADCVCGLRARRNDPFIRRMSSRVGNGVRNQITGHRVRDTGSPLKVIRREYLERIPRFRGLHRFLPTLLARIAGARVVEVPVPHRARHSGASKYGIGNRALRCLRDCFGVRWLVARALRWQDDVPGDDV
jgi:glycosyltransferase involved in cell wall biosynthesis